jgi:putative hemolysin
MILRVRAQSICASVCHHLCVIHGDLLLTSPSVGCCQLVPSFANSLGVFVLFQTSEFHLVWSNGSVAQAFLRCRRPHLHYLVLTVCYCLIFVDFPLCT